MKEKTHDLNPQFNILLQSQSLYGQYLECLGYITLKTGPCKLVPNEGRLGGYMNRGFIFLFINISLTILMKGLTLAFGSIYLETNDEKNWIAAQWILLNLVPQFFFVSFFSFNHKIKYMDQDQVYDELKHSIKHSIN